MVASVEGTSLDAGVLESLACGPRSSLIDARRTVPVSVLLRLPSSGGDMGGDLGEVGDTSGGSGSCCERRPGEKSIIA
jgi:hypothetical protein